MAVISDRVDSRVSLVLETGTDAFGFSILRRKNYSRIKPMATDEAVFNTAVALASLQEFPLYGIDRTDTSSLEQE
ncbi:DUF1659 domain-containing protein [Desulfuribacillus alkaliarsenatis]|uniref:DUF1659 domain-containing protein n=1 Tax=Desulfuribacillus alkaliarsenatis TaxID=766136 RepID=A0A1E5G3S4_9FIRM|nr:DUF1659 domain-containing protein [Desulfuribacillus alkaliarsenatis]OEF97642.1 hypothetical protein BHF68_14440 [Desulfuribacillus alkaliarsenatis]